MTIQSSVGYHPFDLAARGKKLTFELARFAKFIYTEIFPGRIPSTGMMVELGEKAGFRCPSPCRCAITTSRPWVCGRGTRAQ